MFLSVLIPVYNVEKYLSECIESIISQLPPDSEIVLMDDGSTDKSALICDQYSSRYYGSIRVIHKNNEGAFVTRRRLLKASKGEWILFVDSDDFLNPNALDTLKSLLTNRYKTVDILYFDADCILLNGERKRIGINLIPEKTYKGEVLREVYTEKAIGYSLNHMWSKVFRRSIVDFDQDYSDYKNITLGEDSLQTYPLLDSAKSIVYINKVFYSYRKNKSGLTYHSYGSLYPMRLILWPKENYYFSKWNLHDSTWKKVMSKRINEIINYLIAFIIDHHDYSLFRNECNRIVDDGFLEDAVSYVVDDKERRNRYTQHAIHLCEGKFRRVYYELCLEAIISRLREKRYE